ncbi:MAG TPA: Ig-like domain-containing protein [Deltaproteobacteria bacterium]|nr:Ig-like domain-containing protein [Deltaproteobacteria bacterium]
MATKRTPGVFRLILVLSILALFVGCGGGGGGGGEVSGEGDGGGGEGDGSDLNPEDKNPPAIISVTPADSVLGKHDEIVICFSESMDTDSLVLGEALQVKAALLSGLRQALQTTP